MDIINTTPEAATTTAFPTFSPQLVEAETTLAARNLMEQCDQVLVLALHLGFDRISEEAARLSGAQDII